MRKCNKCNLEYVNETNFCKKCGEKLEYFESKEEREIRINNLENKKKKIKTALYCFGILFIYAGFGALRDDIFFGIIGLLFGLSLLPIVNQNIWKIKKLNKIKFIQKYQKILSIILPVFLGSVWILSLYLMTLKLDTITIHDYERIVAINEKYEINFDTNLEKIDLKDFDFISSDSKIAEVKDGIIEGKSEGNVVITIVGDNGITASETYIIKYIDLEKLSIKGQTKINVGNKSKLSVDIEPLNASDNKLTWSSSNPNIISVDNKGNISAINSGKSIITVSSDKGIKDEIEISSYDDVSSISLSETEIRLELGKTTTIGLKVLPDNSLSESISWKSSDENIFDVENGKITANEVGTANLIVESLNGIKAIAKVEVFEIEPESITLNKNELNLSVGQTSQLNATISPYNTSDKSIWWSSSDYNVVSVEDGKVIAKSRGESIITARASNLKEAKIKVKVTEKSPIKINNFRYTIDSVCGVEWTFSIINNSNKKISYVKLKWYNFNGLGEYVYDQINWQNYTLLAYTDPISVGSSSGRIRNMTKFYNCNYKASSISDIEIMYGDGTTENITTSDMKYYTGLGF